jgi:uncharacterized protein (TIGR02145 family)
MKYLTYFFILSCFNLSAQEIRIGNQVWMYRNLSATKFRNGESIFEAKNCKDWNEAIKSQTPAWCYFDFNPANSSKYGILYNYFAIFDKRGLAPENWHIPTISEWNELAAYLGGSNVAGGKMMGNGTRWDGSSGSSLFNAIRSGYLDHRCWFAGPIVSDAIWWSSSLTESNRVYVKSIDFSYDGSAALLEFIAPNTYGFSVRCIKNATQN